MYLHEVEDRHPDNILVARLGWTGWFIIISFKHAKKEIWGSLVLNLLSYLDTCVSKYANKYDKKYILMVFY